MRTVSYRAIPDREPDPLEQAVWALLSTSYPAWLSEQEVLTALAGSNPEFAARDAISNALCELVGGGVLHHLGHFYLATRAAIRTETLT